MGKDYASGLANGGLCVVAVASAAITAESLFTRPSVVLTTAGKTVGLIGGGQLLWTKAKKL